MKYWKEGNTEDAVYVLVDEIDEYLEKQIHPPLEYYDAIGPKLPLRKTIHEL